MYNASDEFHEAVANGAHQIALLIFDRGSTDAELAVFTNDDINVSAGIEFNDYFNAEEDLAIGQALSNEITFSLFNDRGLLDNYAFGEFKATIGAQIENVSTVPVTPDYNPASTTPEIIREPDDYVGRVGDTCRFTVVATGMASYQWQYCTNGYSWKSSSATGNATPTMEIGFAQERYNTYSYRCKMTDSGGNSYYTRPVRMAVPGELVCAEYVGNQYTFYARSPYARMNKSLMTIQPTGQTVSALIYNNVLYCRLADGTIKALNATNGNAVTYTPNSFMLAQMERWKGKGVSFEQATGENWKLRIIGDGRARTYEFVPLGVFIAERPNVPTVNEIHMTCYDQMQKFEKDMMTDAELLTELQKTYPNRSAVYPLTFADLFIALCNKAGVARDTTAFINGTATISKRPDDFDNVTMREVLQWLAEAAASVARFDRDGVLKMDWIRTGTGIEIDETGYSEFNPYWYQTKRITKLYNRASSGEYDNVAEVSGEDGDSYLIQDNPLLKGVS